MCAARQFTLKQGRIRCSLDSAELASELGGTCCGHLGVVEHQRHEDIVWHVPLAGDSVGARGPKPESRIELRMADDYDERAAATSQPIVSRFHQFGSDTVPLFVWQDRHRTKRSAVEAANSRWTVHDVTNDAILPDGDKRQQRAAVSSQSIDDVAFLVLAERSMIHVANLRDVSRFFRSNFDHVADCQPNARVPDRDAAD